MNNKRQITALILSAYPLNRFNRALKWYENNASELKLIGVVQSDFAFRIDSEKLDKLLITKPGPISFQTLEEEIKEEIESLDIDRLIIVQNSDSKRSAKNLLLLSLYFHISCVEIWTSGVRIKKFSSVRLKATLWIPILFEWMNMGWHRISKFFHLNGYDREPSVWENETIELFDPIAGRVLHKGVGKSSLKVARLGYVENDPPLKLESLEPTEKIRIVLLGGSSVYGVGLKHNKDTISSKITHVLKEKYQLDAEVLNFGVTGGWSRSESSLLIYKLIFAKPTIVISFSGWNDFMTQFACPMRYGSGSEIINWTFSDYYHYLIIQDASEIENHHIPFHEKEFVKKFYPFLDHDVFPESGANIRKNTWPNNLSLMAMNCENNGSRFLAILQPHCLNQPSIPQKTFRKKFRQDAGFYFSKNLSEKDLWERYIAEVQSTYDHYRKSLDRLSEKYRHSFFLDFTRIFECEQKKCFVDYMHYSEHGTQIIAEKLADVLNEKSLLKEKNGSRQ